MCRPRLLTENGDLVFQCGNNKNIHLRTSAGGAVYLGSDNLTYIAHLVRATRLIPIVVIVVVVVVVVVVAVVAAVVVVVVAAVVAVVPYFCLGLGLPGR